MRGRTFILPSRQARSQRHGDDQWDTGGYIVTRKWYPGEYPPSWKASEDTGGADLDGKGSSETPTPSAGTSRPTPVRIGTLGAIGIGLLTLVACTNPDNEKSDNPTNAASGVHDSTDTPDAKPKSKWSYSTDTDDMRGITVRYAEIEAENTVSLDFPYGEQRGQMLVRQSEKSGLDIMVGVASGQILCHSFMNGHINVKFDDGPIERFGCSGASDGTSNMVFIKGANGFLDKLKKSEKAIVEAEFFHNGTQQLTFDTANLEWE